MQPMWLLVLMPGLPGNSLSLLAGG